MFHIILYDDDECGIEGHEEQGAEQQGVNVRWRGPSSRGANVRWRAQAAGGRTNGHRGPLADRHGQRR
jgi:hypothetical protein